MNGEYLLNQIENHLRLFFNEAAMAMFKSADIRFIAYSDAVKTEGRCIVIPTDIDSGIHPKDVYKASFNATELTLWSPLPRPDCPGWRALPNDNAPLWHIHESGTILPATNIFKIAWDLLTFREDVEIPLRDKHGRFNSPFSPRLKAGLLEIPVFNEAVAMLISACRGLGDNSSPIDDIGDLLLPPVINLSHDCDVLNGNDFWTQAARLARVFMPIAKGRPPGLSNLWWMTYNTVLPRRYYFNNVGGMIDMERQYRFKSTMYMLNGSGGRYGSRNGLKPIITIKDIIPEDWNTGLHYNYNTHGNPAGLKTQLDELQTALGPGVISGRAHYFRFDHNTSFDLWQKTGIKIDESAGYSRHIGHRCGIAGCYQPYNMTTGKAFNIYEAPLTIMDTTLVDQYGDNAIGHFEAMLKHLSCLGGAMNVIFHPGIFFNPEMPKMLGIYHKLLMVCRDMKSRCLTAEDMLNGLTRRVRP